MVAEPVRAVDRLRAVDPDHEVPVCQHLQDEEGAELAWRSWAGPLSQGKLVAAHLSYSGYTYS